MNLQQKSFLKIGVIIVILLLVGSASYFAVAKKSKNVLPSPETTTNDLSQLTASPISETETAGQKFSDGAHMSFKYPADWKVGTFEHSPGDLNLQPLKNFIPESKNNNIFISITGHCMNTQCLTVFTLDEMVVELGAKIIGSVKAQNVAGYEVELWDGKVGHTGGGNTGYMFIHGKDFVTLSTDIYAPYLEKIIPTLALLAKSN